MSEIHPVLAAFGARLHELRRAAGAPSLRDLEKLTRPGEWALSRSTISEKLRGKTLPEWEFVQSFVRACWRAAAERGIDLAGLGDEGAWEGRYEEMLAAVRAGRRAGMLHQAAEGELAKLRAPHLLPPSARHFAGRAGDLAALSAMLAEPGDLTRVVVVDGPPGVGKTALAVRWGHQAAASFPDGQLYVNLRGFDPNGDPVAPVQVLRRFLDAFGVPYDRTHDVDELVDRYRGAMSRKRVLIVLDNAASTDQVRPLLPGAPGSATLVTSRRRLSSLVAVEGARRHSLGLFTPSDARELLARQLGAERPAAEPGAVDRIIECCAGLPLALTIAAAAADAEPDAARPLDAVRRRLDDARDRLDALVLDDAATDVRHVFSMSFQRLSPAAARLFRLLAAHPGPDLTEPAAASLAGELDGAERVDGAERADGAERVDGAERADGAVPPVRGLLAELIDANLVEDAGGGRFALHDLLRAYAAGLAGPDREAVRRILDHYLHTAHAASRLWDPHKDPIRLEPPAAGALPEALDGAPAASAWLNAEYPVLLRVIRLAAAGGFHRHAWQLAWSMADVFNRHGRWADWLAIARVALESAEHTADPAARARCHRSLGRAYGSLDRPADSGAQLRLAAGLFELIGDHAGCAHVHIDLSRLYGRAGDNAEALRRSTLALAAYEAAGSRPGMANALNGIGWYEVLLDRHDEALTHCEQALALLRGLPEPDPAGEGATLDSIGLIHHRRGEFGRAVACYEEALGLFRREVDHFSEADTLARLGDSHRDLGDADAAERAWQAALDLFERLDDSRHADEVRARLGALVTC